MKTFLNLRNEIVILERKASKSLMDIHRANKLKDMTSEENKLIDDYKHADSPDLSSKYSDGGVHHRPESALLNGWLKHHYDNNYTGIRYRHPDQNPTSKIKAMDALLNRHKTDRDLDVYTGIRNAPKTDENGHAHLPGYTSTSLDRHMAQEFAHGKSESDNTHILHIKLPAGSHAASLHHIGRPDEKEEDEHYEHEHEIMMARGYTIKVNPKPTIHTDSEDVNHHIWHATVVKHEPKDVS